MTNWPITGLCTKESINQSVCFSHEQKETKSYNKCSPTIEQTVQCNQQKLTSKTMLENTWF